MNNSYNKLTGFYSNIIIHQTPENENKTVIPNTGATRHYLQVYVPHLTSTNIVPPIHLLFPNGQTMQSSKPCLLYFPALSEEACEVNIIPSLTHSSLVSIVKIFGDV